MGVVFSKIEQWRHRNELLAKMGLHELHFRRGSILLPLLSLIVILSVFLTTKGHDQTKFEELFMQVCTGAYKSTAESSWPSSLTTKPLRDKCREADDGIDQIVSEFKKKPVLEMLLELTAFSFKSPQEYGNRDQLINALQTISIAFFTKLSDDWLRIIKTVGKTIAHLSTLAFIPGIIGLIYRRTFWPYFIATFSLLVFFDASAGNGFLPDDVLPDTGRILIALLGHALLIILAFRIRRQSNTPHRFFSNRIPSATYNLVLAATLTLVGYFILVGVGSSLWSALGLDWWIYRLEIALIALPLLFTMLRNSAPWSSDTPKNIVICLDGTSNTPDQFELGQFAPTNVFKLFSMLRPRDESGVYKRGTFDATYAKHYNDKQIAFYYTGVGNRYDESPVMQYIGQITGWGASNILERAYRDLVRVYKSGDRIFIFGFSRGAAISRMLARAIDKRGAPRTIWTIRLLGRHWIIRKSKHRTLDEAHVPITVLGCWDTVGAFGIAKTIGGINFQKIDMFKDLSIPDNVEQAYHMVAIDEMRDSFEPTLTDPDPIVPERIIEVWFAGDHAGVGGGWGTPKLSDISLDFLLRQISSGYTRNEILFPANDEWGLYLQNPNSPELDNLTAPVQSVDPDPIGQLRQVSSILYKYRPRKLPLHAIIHDTVFERMMAAMPLYAPQALFDLNDELDDRRMAVYRAIAKMLRTKSISEEEQEAILKLRSKMRLRRWSEVEQEYQVNGTIPEAKIKLKNHL